MGQASPRNYRWQGIEDSIWVTFMRDAWYFGRKLWSELWIRRGVRGTTISRSAQLLMHVDRCRAF